MARGIKDAEGGDLWILGKDACAHEHVDWIHREKEYDPKLMMTKVHYTGYCQGCSNRVIKWEPAFEDRYALRYSPPAPEKDAIDRAEDILEAVKKIPFKKIL